MTTRRYAEQGGRSLGALGAPSEQPIFASNGDVPECAFGDVVVDGEEAVTRKTRQCLPMFQSISDQADQTFRQHDYSENDLQRA
jgi:hypothetical protein